MVELVPTTNKLSRAPLSASIRYKPWQTPPLHEESEHSRRLEDTNDPMDVEKGQQQPSAPSASSPTSVTTTLWQRAEHQNL